MRSTTISQAKNQLSALLDRVRAGESVTITDRGIPVARLEPVSHSGDPAGRIERLARAGLVRPGAGSAPPSILDGPSTRLPRGVSVVEIVLEERRSGW